MALPMPLNGFDYLFRLAALALSFVGFSAIVVTLRRAWGGNLSDIHLLIVRMFIEGGFAVTAMSLLPAAMGLAEAPPDAIWRWSSAVAGLTFGVYLITIGRRRRRVLRARFPWRTILNFVLGTGGTLTLALNAVGFPAAPNAAMFALPLTGFFMMAVLLFLQNLELFIETPAGDESDQLSGRS
jgi:hypothetical protein